MHESDRPSLAAADVHAAHEARQPAGGGLAKAPTLWNRAAGQFRVPAAQHPANEERFQWLATSIRKYGARLPLFMCDPSIISRLPN